MAEKTKHRQQIYLGKYDTKNIAEEDGAKYLTEKDETTNVAEEECAKNIVGELERTVCYVAKLRGLMKRKIKLFFKSPFHEQTKREYMYVYLVIMVVLTLSALEFVITSIKIMSEILNKTDAASLYHKHVFRKFPNFPSTLKAEQAIVISEILKEKHCICLMPTSFGKTLTMISPSIIQASVWGVSKITNNKNYVYTKSNGFSTFS
jgi:hypothetical protein